MTPAVWGCPRHAESTWGCGRGEAGIPPMAIICSLSTGTLRPRSCFRRDPNCPSPPKPAGCDGKRRSLKLGDREMEKGGGRSRLMGCSGGCSEQTSGLQGTHSFPPRGRGMQSSRQRQRDPEQLQPIPTKWPREKLLPKLLLSHFRAPVQRWGAGLGSAPLCLHLTLMQGCSGLSQPHHPHLGPFQPAGISA